jgi:precorrin-6B methylase 1
MPSKTLTDRVIDLEKAGAVVFERLGLSQERLNEVSAVQVDTARATSDLRREYERIIALLQRDIDDLKKWKDEQKKEREERTRRAWAFGPNLTAALLTIVLAPLSVKLWNLLAVLLPG